MPSIFSWLAAGASGTLLVLAGCSQEIERAGTEILEESHVIDPDARLTIRNLSGSISIRGADTQKLTLHATKKAASLAQLKNIHVKVAAEAGFVSISTTVLPPRKGSFSNANSTVDYVIVVPRTVRIAGLELDDGKVFLEGLEGGDLRANVVDGELTVRNCCGDLQLAVANGELDLFFEDCGQRPFSADAQITHGNARVSIPRGVSFHARAQTTRGKIANDFVDMVDVNGRSIQKIDMSVGQNARSQLAVRVTTGDISLVAVKSELATGQHTASNAGGQ